MVAVRLCCCRKPNTPMSTATQDSLVKVYTLQVRNPLLSKVWGTLFSTQNKAQVDAYRTHPNWNNEATQIKITTRLFRKSVADAKFPVNS